jgi:very-short-patch-repair endonuclease
MSSALGKLRKQQQLAAHAHRMRLTPSEPERLLWRALRASQLGVQFRRQVVVQGYIIDFFAPAARLVVEVPNHRIRAFFTYLIRRFFHA